MKTLKDWHPPDNWLKIDTIDCHTEGEPLRIIVGGFPDLPGDTILKSRRYAMENLDHLRTALMWEPRGHADMYGCILVSPVTPEADIGVLFMHNEGFSTMCGHGIIGLITFVLETGMIPKVNPETTVKIDTPAGLVTAYARIKNNRVQSVYFHNVPSFALVLDNSVDIPGLGSITYDIGFGGAFYAYVKAEDAGLLCIKDEYRHIIEKGKAIKQAVIKSYPVVHPIEEDLSFLYGTIFIAPPLADGADCRSVCVFAEGEVDRSPTGTGVSGRLAILHARGEVELDQPVVTESIIGSRFTGRVVGTTSAGKHNAVIPEVEGTAHITGRSTFLIDPEDPLRDGFILR